MRHRARLSALAIGLCVLMGCDGSSPTSPQDPQPRWLQALIAEIESQPVTSPPSSIWRYRYRDDVVYFRPTRCCDFFSDLYDRAGNLLCHPDGGLTGTGDGRCPDFFAQRTDAHLVWQDPRM